MKRFEELVVVEIGGSLAGAYCGKLFADHGASVIVVGPGELTAAQRVYCHQRKEMVEGAGVEAILAGRQVDVTIASSAYSNDAGQLSADAGIQVRITPYGSTGPASGWRATDATLYAHSGHTHLTGDPDREPLTSAPHHPSYAAGLFGFIGAMGALFDLHRNGVHNHVEVSHLEVLTHLHQLTFMRHQLGKDVLRRMGNRYTGQGQPNGLYECADGWIAISAPTDPQVEMLLLVAGLSELLEHPDISSPMDFQSFPDVLDDQLAPWLKSMPMLDAAELLQSVRVPAAPARPMLGLLDDEHLADREFWEEHEGYRLPRPSFSFVNESGQGAPLPASDGSGPLSGVRVLDLAKVWAGPLAARTLAELGAEVIQVESPWNRGPQELPESLVWAMRLFPDNVQGPHQWNRNGHLIKYGLHKKSAVLDLTKPEGVEAFERLAAQSDVVIENYSTRVMPQLGLDEHRLHEVNPALIYMTMPGYGRSGPAEQWVAYGTTVDSHAGLSHLIGYPGQTPWKCGTAWPDPIAGLHATCAMLIALWRRAERGGVTIEAAQFESTVAIVGDAVVEAQMRGEEAPVRGNRHPDFAPQGIYPAKGDDQWVVISVHDDAGWEFLCREAHFPVDWRTLDVDGRRHHHDEIDETIAAWSANFDKTALADFLQGVGIAAAPDLSTPEVMADGQLGARGAFFEVAQPEVGRFANTLMPLHFSGRPERGPLRHAALLGEHNHEVLGGIAGLSAAEIEALEAAGIVATEPPE